ncbi:MAG: CDP-alcohol phosphatidyltransferase family protein, partial [Christensenellaceae bacterium]|nr:CDP-alcohol phosphatidyltransferase family protein [Christensenellaceae bacterium]
MISAFIILFAMIFDALDGFVARLLNASSIYGVEMDSLSDMVTFGVAPATIV